MHIWQYYIKKTLDGNAKMYINSKNVHTKLLRTIEKDNCFYLIRKNAHKLWWKHIYRINPTMRFEKVMWLCDMRWDILTVSGLISFTASIVVLVVLKAWAKSVVRVFLYNCQMHPPQKAMTALLCFVCSLWDARNLLYMKVLYQWLLLVFVEIFSASL